MNGRDREQNAGIRYIQGIQQLAIWNDWKEFHYTDWNYALKCTTLILAHPFENFNKIQVILLYWLAVKPAHLNIKDKTILLKILSKIEWPEVDVFGSWKQGKMALKMLKLKVRVGRCKLYVFHCLRLTQRAYIFHFFVSVRMQTPQPSSPSSCTWLIYVECFLWHLYTFHPS